MKVGRPGAVLSHACDEPFTDRGVKRNDVESVNRKNKKLCKFWNLGTQIL